MDHEIIVSIATVTYNHSKYIEQCIQSVLNQKTDFKFEMIIGDDASTDGTTEIIKKYEALYPEIIKPVYHQKNMGKNGSGGGRENFNSIIEKCTGKYVAILNGDDFMLPGKLQKQVKFMETNQQLSMCGHNVKVIDQSGTFLHYFNNKNTPLVADAEYLVKHGTYIANTSVLYKRQYLDIHMYNKLHPYTHGDWLLHIIVARAGGVGYIDEPLAVYRKHTGGITNRNRASLAARKKVFNLQLNIINAASKLGLDKNATQEGKGRLYYIMAIDMLEMHHFDDAKIYLNEWLNIVKPITVKEKIMALFRNYPKLIYTLIHINNLLSKYTSRIGNK